MELLKNFRLNRSRSSLRRKMARTKKARFNGNILNAKSVGIVWDASKPEEFQVLSQFQKGLQERGIEVKIIGFFPGKVLPDRLTAIKYLTCLKSQDINFFYKPVSYEAEKFISTRFDILIDINFKNMFPLEYLSSLSLAGLKVGIFDNEYENNPFDFMMEVDRNSDIRTYLEQVVHYLEMINTKTALTRD